MLGDLERLQHEIEEKKRREEGGGERPHGGSEADSALSVPPLDLKKGARAPPASSDGEFGQKGGDATITPRLVELDLTEDVSGDERAEGTS